MNEIVEDTYIAGERDARQGVREMLIKCGEETEAMLTGQVGTSPGAGVGNINASRFASEDVVALEHRNRKSSLDQLMRSAKATNAATQNRDLRRHHRLAITRRFSRLVETWVSGDVSTRWMAAIDKWRCCPVAGMKDTPDKLP